MWRSTRLRLQQFLVVGAGIALIAACLLVGGWRALLNTSVFIVFIIGAVAGMYYFATRFDAGSWWKIAAYLATLGVLASVMVFLLAQFDPRSASHSVGELAMWAIGSGLFVGVGGFIAIF